VSFKGGPSLILVGSPFFFASPTFSGAGPVLAVCSEIMAATPPWKIGIFTGARAGEEVQGTPEVAINAELEFLPEALRSDPCAPATAEDWR
jgi:hypothetical protein